MTGLLFGKGYRQQVDRLRAERPHGRSPGAPGLNCLVLGSGGREHAIAWALARAASVATIDCIPGNGGTPLFARTLDGDPRDAAALERHVAAAHIDLAVVGPDDLVAQGIGDVLRRAGIAVVGPSREAARIEWSKSFAKELMREAGVPTAAWHAYPNADAAREALPDGPIVVKADGLAAGKGVVVARTREEALAALGSPQIRDGAVVIEELLDGEEASLHALVDGETVVALPLAKDHKRRFDGDAGPNTGGMGAVSPHPSIGDAEAQALADLLIAPVARALVARGTPYRGVIFAGLMGRAGDWRVLEYNARFGDPEAEVILPRLEADVGKLFLALGEGRLAAYVAETPLRFSPRAYVDVVLCAEGYPGAHTTGDAIEGLETLPEHVYVFHAGTKRVGTRILTAGGRVLHAVGHGDDIEQARERAYAAAERISWPGRSYRSDIASRGVEVA